jgi:hypothetical protein
MVNQAYSQEGKVDLSVTMKVTNMNTGTVKTKVWNLSAYTFEQKIPIEVSDFKLDKIMKIYGTDSFTFTLDNKEFGGKWLHFKVELIGTPLAGRILDIRFI